MGFRKFGPLLLPDFEWLETRIRLKWIFGLALLIPIAAIVYIALGGAPVAANRPDSWAARHLLHFTFKRSVAASAGYVAAPKDLDSPGRVKLGAQGFSMVCANCHGTPGAGQSVVALSMNPRPQYLPHVVGQFSDSELFVIVRDGVRFSAMPAWPTAGRDDEIWSMVAFLRRLPTMDAASYATLAARPALDAPAMPREPAAALRPADASRAAPPKDEFLYAAPAVGFGAPLLASNPAVVCAGCHGAGDGAPTQGEAPNLTIQDSAYLRAALDNYLNGARKSGYMQEIASQLSAAQIGALADYYGSRPPAASPQPASAADPAMLRRGEEIARHGVAATATPACANCHDSAGAKVSGAPHIAGQAAVYLRRQLVAMRNGDRGATRPWNPMPAEAHDLSDPDVEALVVYYAAQKPTKGEQPASMSASAPRGDANKGHALFSEICSKCHLGDGRGDSDGLRPDLTLQSAAYVAQALQAFRAERRGGNKMYEVTQSLSLADIADLAAYVQALDPQPSTMRPPAQEDGAAARLAANGDAARHVPACDRCHGGPGVSALPLVPRLNGQGAAYLQARLDRFANAREGEVSGLNPMPQIAARLTPEERATLALHYANAAPLPKTQEAAAR